MDRLEAEEAMEGELTEESTEKHLGQQPKKFYAEWCRFILDLLLFYTTAFFVLLAVFSLFALVFLVPFFIDPAWSTLQADFDPMGTQCRTISGDYLEGRSLCDWSSCQEGCTKTVYTCWKIIVEYEVPGINPGDHLETPVASGKLFPNVKGCGYPPNVDCHNFLKTYGRSGTNFTCYVSRSDPALVIVNLNLQEVKAHLFYSIAVPFPCLLLSLLYLILAYKFIYNDPRPNKKEATYRPVASAAASGSSALAAFIDIRDSGEDQDLDRGQGDKERQRKFLLQLQRTKWLAQHGKLASDKSAGSSTNSVRINELMQHSNSSNSDAKSELTHMERMKKDRNAYSSEKHRVMHYYQYYSLHH